jgi:hypothetical protein
VLGEELGEVDTALFQVGEMTTSEAMNAVDSEHALNHFDGVVAGVEQGDCPFG